MPLLPKRDTDTCGCSEGEAPEPSCVYHGVGSYLLLRQVPDLEPVIHIVGRATVEFAPAFSERIYRVYTLCLSHSTLTSLPWSEAEESEYLGSLRNELRVGDRRITPHTNQLGTGSPTCPECQASKKRGAWNPPEVLTVADYNTGTIHLRRFAGEGPPRCGWLGRSRGYCLECLRPGTWVESILPVLTAEEHRRRKELRRNYAEAVRTYLEGLGWVLDPQTELWSHAEVGGRRRDNYSEEKALKCQNAFLNGSRPEDRTPASRFERDV